MTLSFAVRMRAHAAGLEDVATRVLGGVREAADLLALCEGPLPLLGTMAAAVSPGRAAVVGLLPVSVGGDVATAVEKALAHRAAAEAEVFCLKAESPCTAGALDLACETARRLLSKLPGTSARIDRDSLLALATGAGVEPSGAAGRLAQAGVTVSRPGLEVPPAIDEAFVSSLLEREKGPLSLKAGPQTTGIVLLRAVAVARLAGHGPLAIGTTDELKGPDACLSFGADILEAELDPPGTMNSRTRSYGEAAIRGAQLQLVPPSRRGAATRKIAHILDENVDPSLLPGGLPEALPEVR